MENFNTKRFSRTFRWLFSENRYRLLAWSIGLVLAFFAIETLFALVGLRAANEVRAMSFQAMGKASFSLCIALAFAVAQYGFSEIFSTLKTRQKRIAYLTLPATNLERYLAAFLLAVVIAPVCIGLALLIGDALRTVFFALMGHGWYSNVAYAWRTIISPGSFSSWGGFLECCAENAMGLWGCSLYVLGGTWFRRRGFLIVTAFMILLMIIGTYLLRHVFGDAGIFVVDANDGVTFARPYVYVVLFALIALSVFNFWLSYRIFTRFQVITSKWTNV